MSVWFVFFFFFLNRDDLAGAVAAALCLSFDIVRCLMTRGFAFKYAKYRKELSESCWNKTRSIKGGSAMVFFLNQLFLARACNNCRMNLGNWPPWPRPTAIVQAVPQVGRGPVRNQCALIQCFVPLCVSMHRF